jgi:DmsE family decaheme c-type cytochrome
VSGGTAGDGFVKNNRGIDGCFGLTNASPSGAPNKSKFGLNRKFLLVATSGLALWAALLVSQPARAEATLTVADISATLRGSPPAAPSQAPSQQVTADDAVSTLAAFAEQIGSRTAAPASPAAPAARQIDDQSLSALKDFAQRLGNAQPASIKTLPKLAEAETLMDFLAGKGSSETPAATSPKASGGKRSSAPVEAHFIGAQACQTCHAPLIAEFKKTLMGKIGTVQKGKFDCENCHGPGSAHVKAGGGRGVGGILSFGKDDPRPVDERNAVCLACHQKGERNYWAGSVHETRGVACTNCHTVMKNVSRKHQLKTQVEAETCYQCHSLKRAQMQFSSHMPIREGKVTCSDCHNPHGSITEKLIRQASVNENCYKCHAEKRGPMLWEHAPVRENCLNCHNPHGSNYEFLLKVARPRLCNECHSTVHSPTAGGGLGLPNTPYTLGRGCGNCHSNIHGSNKPNGMFFIR